MRAPSDTVSVPLALVPWYIGVSKGMAGMSLRSIESWPDNPETVPEKLTASSRIKVPVELENITDPEDADGISMLSSAAMGSNIDKSVPG